MSEMKITFKHPDEILDFVNTVSKYEFDMDMKKRTCSRRCKVITWNYASWY